jgi:hypothetical protein
MRAQISGLEAFHEPTSLPRHRDVALLAASGASIGDLSRYAGGLTWQSTAYTFWLSRSSPAIWS